MFLVKLSANSSIPKLVKIRRILHQSVSWEALRKNDKIQCKRCQRIGHVAKNCNLKFRCVKCNETHDPGNCKIQTSEGLVEKSSIFCVHCQNYGHPASYRGCPKLVEYDKKIKKKLEEESEIRRSKIDKFANRVNPGISYSTVVTNKTNTDSQPATSIMANTEMNINNQKNDERSFPATEESDNSSGFVTQLQKIQDVVNQNAQSIEKLFELLNKLIKPRIEHE